MIGEKSKTKALRQSRLKVGMQRLGEMNRERRAMLGRWVLADSLGILVLGYAAQALVARTVPSPGGVSLVAGFAVVPVTVFLLWVRGLYAIQAKYLNLKDVVDLFKLGLASALALSLVEVAGGASPSATLLVAALYFLGFAPVLGAIRGLHKRIEGGARPKTDIDEDEGLRTLVLGGGDAGEMTVREILRMRAPTHKLVGIVDDDLRKSYTQIHGVPVVGTTGELEELVRKLDVQEILIAVPSADGDAMRHLVSVCKRTHVRVQTLPGVNDLLAGRFANQIRDIEISDLLRRKPLSAESVASAELLRGEVVLITGAGGSIGSELVRQAARMEPKRLILVGKGENSIFEIEQQLVREGFPPPVAVIADVRDAHSMGAIFKRYRPSVVFHAAAHKHVPLMEGNPIEAVRNNVFGTINVAEAALAHGAKKLVLVSTDKAVNPENIMGATKRVAELAVRAWTEDSCLDSTIVRFGNVLGSRGSLVPMLKAQIRSGGPVRITHPGMTRYFMTIPEAVQLTLRAAAIGSVGEAFILDMGEPIRILDLANDLIRLMGHDPDGTMPIVFTGIRPGEKLEEELSYDFEQLVETSEPKIRVARSSQRVDPFRLRGDLEHLWALCDTGTDGEVRAMLMQIASQSHPACEPRPTAGRSLNDRK